MKILLVDDDPILVHSIRIGLKKNGCHVLEAYDGQQALELLCKAESEIDLVISDYMMPIMSGIDLLKAIRKSNPTLPVIIMTSYADVSLIIEAIKNQCSGFLEKPFSLNQLLSEISRIKDLEA